MDFKDSIKQISERIDTLKANLPTEEATKTALIMPFINALAMMSSTLWRCCLKCVVTSAQRKVRKLTTP